MEAMRAMKMAAKRIVSVFDSRVVERWCLMRVINLTFDN